MNSKINYLLNLLETIPLNVKAFQITYVNAGMTVEQYTNRADGTFTVKGNKIEINCLKPVEIAKRLECLKAIHDITVNFVSEYSHDEARYFPLSNNQLKSLWDESNDLYDKELIENELRRRNVAILYSFI